MRQIYFAVLIALIIVGLTKEPGLAQSALDPVDLPTNSQDMRLIKDPTLSQAPPGKSLIMAQSTTQKTSATNAKSQASQVVKPKSNPITTPTSDRTTHYQCLEYCVVVRQSCEGLVAIQPDVKIATIGSKQNSRWSGECQKIYNSCMKKCDTDENTIHWKRAKVANNKPHNK